MVENLTMRSGRTVRCTKEHKWYMQRKDKTHRPYLPARIGRKLKFVYSPPDEPTTEQLLVYGYLAGIIDGEGACNHGSIFIHQSLEVNPEVCERIEQTLQKLDIPYTKTIKLRYDERFNKPTNCFTIWLKGGVEQKLKIIKFGNPAKKQRILNTIWKRTNHFVREEDEIMDIKQQGFETIYGLTTGAGNYIAWGYASENSAQYQNEAISREDRPFKYINFYDNLDQVPKKENLRIITSVDPAISQLKSADKFAIITVGIDKADNWWVLDYYNGRYLPDEGIIKILKMRQKWHPYTIALETIAFQKVLKYMLEQYVKKMGIPRLPIHECKPGKAKDLRIMGLQPLFENGQIFVRKNMGDLIDQIETYPKCQFDDLLDALANILELAGPPVGECAKAPEIVGEKTEDFLELNPHLRRNRNPTYVDEHFGENF